MARAWTAGEDEYLIALCARGDVPRWFIAQQIERSIKATSTRIQRLGITTRCPPKVPHLPHTKPILPSGDPFVGCEFQDVERHKIAREGESCAFNRKPRTSDVRSYVGCSAAWAVRA